MLRRENGILKRLRSTPLPPATYVASLLVSTLLVFALQTLALFLLGGALYSTPFPADVASLIAAIVVGTAVFATLGTATASVIRSAEGSSAVVNSILLPMAFLSGSFGETRHLPAFLRAIADVLPLKYFIDLVNAVYLRGHAIWTRPEDLAVLAAWGLFGLLFTIRKFRWEPRGQLVSRPSTSPSRTPGSSASRPRSAELPSSWPPAPPRRRSASPGRPRSPSAPYRA